MQIGETCPKKLQDGRGTSINKQLGILSYSSYYVIHAEISPFERERKICERIKDKLIADGLFLVGINLIAGKRVEINCISPGGIPRINRLNGDKLESKVIDFIQAQIRERRN